MKHFRAMLVGVMLAGFTFVGVPAEDVTPIDVDNPTCMEVPGDSTQCLHP